jgi:hypothetical protein
MAFIPHGGSSLEKLLANKNVNWLERRMAPKKENKGKNKNPFFPFILVVRQTSLFRTVDFASTEINSFLSIISSS